ncbi:cell division protein SepF [Fictibacillus enclensis]|uniref:Cell division protein SepF n=1 Tax=Fictibacillus solisalsi TaxID=459525 RepID=A0A1G9UTP3_9BACL|nr:MULTISPECIES: cell division protein SepF [Fictibacillus]MDM5198792.1 cell division protein SepF [Fictibacillus enclensis]MDM5337994.1 cell division protein SepF [Fictibacillus enclensis]WHY74348.1 cell division protein SepF [Fictibacillus enclensis]SDM63243.1 cell division inhibitor SepF [Fictibacillus solisalsi]
MSIKNKFKRFFDLEEDEYVYEEVVEENGAEMEEGETMPAHSKKNKQNVVSLQSVHQQSKVVLLEPRVYAEAQDIADQLKNRRAVVMNLQRIPHDQAKRIVDFLSGTVYAIGGDIQKLGPNTFLCTPENVDVSGSISEMLEGE